MGRIKEYECPGGQNSSVDGVCGGRDFHFWRSDVLEYM